MGRRTLPVFRGILVLVLALACSPAGARAATITLGPSFSDHGGIIQSAPLFTYVQVEDSSKYYLVAPADGVVTSWDVSLHTAGSVRLIALTPQADGSYTAGATTQTHAANSGANTFNDLLLL